MENSIILELHKKQDKEDEGLATTSKNVVGAINEVKQKALDTYGPYENTTLEEIATMLYDRLTPGKTIGVTEDGKIVEYWWQITESKEVLVYWDDVAGLEFSYNFIGEIENIDETPLYEWGDDSGARVYTKTKNSTSAENEVYRLVDGALYSIAPIDRIIQDNTYAFVKKEGATIEQDIKTNVACGALPAGSTIDAGKTFTEVIRLLTSKVLLASRHTDPSATITSTIPNNTTKEVGETIAPILTATFNDGKFNYYETDAISTSTINAGCTATAYQILRGTTSITTTSNSVADSYRIPLGNTIYTCEITHSASASDRPTNSDGSVNTNVQFSSDTVTSNSITINGAYKYFYGSANVLPTNVRSLTNSFNRPSSVNMSGTKWFLYVPKSYTQPTSFKTLLETYVIENETTDNQDKKGVILKKEVTVKDAGGNDVKYYRYMMQLDNPLGSNINIG